MKTPEEIKNALRMCSTWEKNCEECPYKPMKKAISCSSKMKRDSLTYIEQLEKRASLNTLRDAVYEDAVKHGLYDDVPEVEQAAVYLVSMIKFEIYEAWAAALDWEAHGSGAQDHFAEELADVIIMTLSACGHLGIDIDAAVRRKMEINRARPWKHGKDEKK